MELLDIVLKLTGPIDPIGETHADNARFENLKQLLQLMKELHAKVDAIANTNCDRGEFSMRRAGLECQKYLNWLGVPE